MRNDKDLYTFLLEFGVSGVSVGTATVCTNPIGECPPLNGAHCDSMLASCHDFA